MKGRSIYFTKDELWWINLTMANQDDFSDESEREISQSVYEKTMKREDDINHEK